MLISLGKIEQDTVDKVYEYIKSNQIFPDGKLMSQNISCKFNHFIKIQNNY